MPQWLEKIAFWKNAPQQARDGYDHEWAEFNLPAASDLRALLSMCAKHGAYARNPGNP